ncbi:hypothetical protein ABK249_02810 [Neorhizobium sp. Rsf11]|uniref:Phosphoadenosine phosphosulphate reductase domain-containing protein n=1 Tax=Neorhizobium phenanthreniclasticum TaxID=3157917 RepID=A0ABV0LW71_9HYPH
MKQRKGSLSWGPVKDARLRVLSLGAGIQSTTLLLMAAHGEIEKPDVVIFADTGAEPGVVYEHLKWLSNSQVQPFEIITVSAGSILDDLRQQVAGNPVRNQGRAPCAPFYTSGRDGRGAPLRRQCTSHYKIEPIQRKIREIMGFKARQRIPAFSVEMIIGISSDEVARAGSSFVPWIVNRYPLLEKRMSRYDCELWLKQNDYPVPTKSACTFCPYRTNSEWRNLRETDVAGFAQAVEVDSIIRPGLKRNDKGTSTGRLFLHRSLTPLSELDLSTDFERGQYDFLLECEGGCGL